MFSLYALSEHSEDDLPPHIVSTALNPASGTVSQARYIIAFAAF